MAQKWPFSLPPELLAVRAAVLKKRGEHFCLSNSKIKRSASVRLLLSLAKIVPTNTKRKHSAKYRLRLPRLQLLTDPTCQHENKTSLSTGS
jgi:hypothetical protein